MSKNNEMKRIISHGEMRSNICVAELREEEMKKRGIDKKETKIGEKSKSVDSDLSDKVVCGTAPVELEKLRKKATNKILIKDESKTNTKFINEMVRLGNIYTEVNDIELDMYELNENSEIAITRDNIKCIRKSEMIRNIPLFLVEEDIYTEGYNSLIANKIEGQIEKIVSEVLSKSIYKHSITTSESFVTMIRKIPKILRKNLTIVGNSVDIAILKLILSKSGYNQDDILGIKYFILEELDKAYILNLGFLKINYCLMSIDKRKRIIDELYDLKVAQYYGGEIACKDALIELEIQAGA